MQTLHLSKKQLPKLVAQQHTSCIVTYYYSSSSRNKNKNRQTTTMRTKQTARKSCTKSALDKNLGTGFAKKSCTTTNVTNRVVRPPSYRHASGAKVLTEIRYYQTATGCQFIKRLPFQRIVRSICQGLQVDMRFQVAALEALQVASEDFVTQFFEHINLCAVHAKRATIMPRDIRLAQKLKHF